jgi:CRP-like cAMP-binding protein
MGKSAGERAAKLVALGQLEPALAAYQEALKGAPEDAGLRQGVAEVLERLGRRGEAVAAWEAAAGAWARAGQPLRAMVACQGLLRLEPGHTRALGALADAYARRAPTGGAKGAAFELLPETEGARDGVPFFSKLERDAFVAMVAGLAVRAVEVGGSVVVEGEAGASMFALVEGRVEVVRHLADGQRKMVGSLAAGDCFGELALISEGPRLASVVAGERTVLLELTRAHLERVRARFPAVEQGVQAFYRERLVANLLRSSPLFTALKPELKDAVAREFQLRTVEAGVELLKQGQVGDAFYLLLRGRCTPFHEHPNGREEAYPTLSEGDVFGEISLLLDKPVTATVRADTACVVLRLDRAVFERTILSQPGTRGALMRVGTERLQRTAKLLSGRALHDGDLRV